MLRYITLLLWFVMVGCKSQDSSIQNSSKGLPVVPKVNPKQSIQQSEISKGAIRISGTVLKVEKDVISFEVDEIVGTGPNYIGDLNSAPKTVQSKKSLLQLKKDPNLHFENNSNYLLEVLLNQENSSVGRILKLLSKSDHEKEEE